MSNYIATRRIEIDAGHRVARHDSKCRSLHGHRYVIEAAVAARELTEEGSSTGMVADFGVLKEAMMERIHAQCDHALLIHIEDEELLTKLFTSRDHLNRCIQHCREQNGCMCEDGMRNKIYLLNSTPTAENLAEHWYNHLHKFLKELRGRLTLEYVKVWETPNCWAKYGEQR